jgi:hypothetical protein
MLVNVYSTSPLYTSYFKFKTSGPFLYPSCFSLDSTIPMSCYLLSSLLSFNSAGEGGYRGVLNGLLNISTQIIKCRLHHRIFFLSGGGGVEVRGAGQWKYDKKWKDRFISSRLPRFSLIDEPIPFSLVYRKDRNVNRLLNHNLENRGAA